MKKLKKPHKSKGFAVVQLYDGNECTIIKNNYCENAKCVRTCEGKS